METVVSGIRPTGNLHLGNYFGAVKNFLKMQDEYKCFFFIADWHSLTTHPHRVTWWRTCGDSGGVSRLWFESREGDNLRTK